MVTKKELAAKIDSHFLSHIQKEKGVWKINAQEVYYRDLNVLLRTMNGNGVKKIEITNVFGQRYIGTNLEGTVNIDIYGTPGNDLGAFMNGPKVTVYGNAQDCCGNTMNQGQIVVHGRSGDITGYSMRGGKIFIRDDVGYRAGIHMKEYHEKRPYLVVGGTAQDFLGEYMAGGVLVVLGLNLKTGERHKAKYVGTGMHGGVMYIRGGVTHLGKEVDVMDLNVDDKKVLHNLVNQYCDQFGGNTEEILRNKFIKIIPVSHRPYGRLYAY